MSKTNLIALTGAVMALTFALAQPALAQSSGEGVVSEQPTRLEGPPRRDGEPERRSPRERRRQSQEPAASTPGENRVAAQAILTGATIDCQVSEANLLGSTADQHATYEAVCAEGPGYLVVSSTPPQTFNCLELAGQARTNRMRDPEADVGQQCTLPANVDPVPALSGFARDAGVACAVDRGGAVGRSPAGNVIYEIGCANRDGFWIEKASGGWTTTPCWDLALADLACRYTTPEDVRASWRGVLAGSPAEACEVQRGRRIGRDAQGLRVYEIKCAGDDGYFVRVDAAWKAKAVSPCATSQNILGGCTLTQAPAGSEP